MGQASSMGAVLLAAGAKGKRSALRHSRVMIHQPLGGSSGQAAMLEIYTKEILKVRDSLYEILATPHRPGRREDRRPTATATSSCRPRRRRQYGIVDKVIENREELHPKKKD